MGAIEITLSNRTREKAENLKKLYSDLEVVNWGQNTDFDIIKDIHKFMGIGHLIDIKSRVTVKGTQTKPQKRWQTTHRQTYEVLKQILPYMKEKNKRKKVINAQLIVNYKLSGIKY